MRELLPGLIDLRHLEPLPDRAVQQERTGRKTPSVMAGVVKRPSLALGALNRDGSYFCSPFAQTDDLGLIQTDIWDKERQSFVKVRPIRGGAGLALVERYINTITPAGGLGSSVLPFFVDMPRGFIYGGLMLDCQNTVTVAGGVTNGTLNDEEPLDFIQRVVFEGTGGGAALQLKNMKARQFFRAHHLLVGKEPQLTPLANAGVQTATPVRFLLPIWFALPGALVPPEVGVQSVLDPSEYGKLTLEVDFGLTTDFINGGDRTVTIPTASCDVYALQAVNVSVTKNRPYRYIETYFLRDALAAIATERKLSNPIPVGRPIRYLLLETRNEVANARQPVDDTLGTIKLFISQTQILRYNNFRAYVERNRSDNHVFDAVNPAGHNPLSSRDNPAIGYYMFDFAKGGRLDGILDASRFPARGVPIDFLHDVLIATARQLDVNVGFLVPGGAR